MKTSHHPSDVQLRNALLGLAGDIAATQIPPPSAAIWFRAQQRARQLAIRRATRPLRIMYAFGVIASLLATAFVLYQSQQTVTPSAIIALLKWTAPAAFLILAGCWIMLRQPPIEIH